MRTAACDAARKSWTDYSMAPIGSRTQEGRTKHPSRGMVFVVASDQAVRRSLVSLLRAFAFSPEPYAGLEAFFRAYDGREGCLTIDLHLISADPCSCARSIREAAIDLPIVLLDGAGGPDRPLSDRRDHPAPELPVRILQQPADSLTYIATVESLLA